MKAYDLNVFHQCFQTEESSTSKNIETMFSLFLDVEFFLTVKTLKMKLLLKFRFKVSTGRVNENSLWKFEFYDFIFTTIEIFSLVNIYETHFKQIDWKNEVSKNFLSNIIEFPLLLFWQNVRETETLSNWNWKNKQDLNNLSNWWNNFYLSLVLNFECAPPRWLIKRSFPRKFLAHSSSQSVFERLHI